MNRYALNRNIEHDLSYYGVHFSDTVGVSAEPLDIQSSIWTTRMEDGTWSATVLKPRGQQRTLENEGQYVIGVGWAPPPSRRGMAFSLLVEPDDDGTLARWYSADTEAEAIAAAAADLDSE